MKNFFKKLSPKSAVVLVITIAMLTLTFLAGLGLFFIEIPENNKEMINLLMGGIISWTGAIVSQYFGRDNGKYESLDEHTKYNHYNTEESPNDA